MWIHKLRASERPSTLYEYTVEGQGTFPIDMLRYDNCWPSSSQDLWKMMDNHKEPREIKLRSYSKPTNERWASFMWSVK